MDAFLSQYIGRVRPALSKIPEKAAHQLAFAFLSFKMGIYHDAVTRCDHALKILGGQPVPHALVTSLRIVRERAVALSHAQYDAKLPLLFSKEDLALGIIDPSEPVVDASLFQLTNALLLLYSAGLVASPEDEQALEEQEKYVLQLLATYRKSLQP